MTPTPWIIVWDLDHTLGVFESLVQAPSLSESVTVWLRPGIEDTLDRLREAGFVHTVLTVGTPPYAETVLRGTKLRERFAEVSGRGDRPKGDAAGIAARFGIDEAERPARMLFVGDHPHLDPPSDKRIVFHLEPRALQRSASAVEQLVLRLREEGGGDLRAGFDRFYGHAPGEDVSGEVVRRHVPDLGELLMRAPAHGGPIVTFGDRPQATGKAKAFVPADFAPH